MGVSRAFCVFVSGAIECCLTPRLQPFNAGHDVRRAPHRIRDRIACCDAWRRDAVRVGPVRSTMMMPAADVYAVEKAITKILPDMEFIRLDGSGDFFRD